MQTAQLKSSNKTSEMIKSLKLEEKDWARLELKLAQDHSPSVMLIRPKMKQVLGFTNRNHVEWIPKYNKHGNHTRDIPKKSVMLDFFSEKKFTWFMLKYGDYVNEKAQ